MKTSAIMNPPCVFTVDVEDWFHILDLEDGPAIQEWDALPSRVEENFCRLLDLFTRHQTRTTCFFLGWVAERYPHLVKQAAREGHEIASHGYGHGLAFRMTPEEFLEDARRAREILEQITGEPVMGYRAPGFSATGQTPWFFDRLAEAGYLYDSSVFPARRGHGGWAGTRREPHAIATAGGARLVEFPVTVADVLGQRLCLFGGGYLRLAPWKLAKAAAEGVLRQGVPVIFYVHPRELDVNQPRLGMNAVRKFKSYVNLAGTERKVENILAHFRFKRFRDIYEESWGEPAAAAARSGSGGKI